MYSYVNHELPDIINSHFHIDSQRQSITGFSVGGLGALLSYLKNSGNFRSVSAFAPVSHPTECNWGKNAFSKFLGSVEAGRAYDPTWLVQSYHGPKTPILIDLGTDDKFTKEKQLLVNDFLDAAHKSGLKVDFKLREGYGHNFFYIATFMGEHIDFHARYLKA